MNTHKLRQTRFSWLSTGLGLLICLIAVPAQAQYYPQVSPGYELVTPEQDDMYSLASPHPKVLAAQESCGLELDGLFRVESGMSRFFTMSWNEDGDGEYLTEYELIPTGNAPLPRIEPVSYEFEGGEVWIGWGSDPEEDWNPVEIVSFFAAPDGRMEELARWECGAHYCYGIYALDLTVNGVVNLVVPWATGAGSGGGVEVMAVVPTGGLAAWGDDGMSGTFYSAVGNTELFDADEDGDWELALYYPLFYSAAGYVFTEIITFDHELYDWVDGEHVAPELYAEEHAFYRQLAKVVRDFIKHPEDYRATDAQGYNTYECTIDGETCSLDVFITGPEGELDYTWIDQLLDMVDGWDV
ncbi:hypothetical protein JW859_06265 [bacterium]|nr:hypothetical protein [bacterium]